MRTKLHRAVLCFAGLQFAAVAMAATIEPQDVRATKSGETTYFRMQVPMPLDAAPLPSFNKWTATPRFPIIVSNPVFTAPCYMVTNRRDEWSAAEGTDVFVGRTQTGDLLKLRLIYPKKEGGWGDADLKVDLKGAAKFTKQSMSIDGSTTTTELTPSQQFARAEAEYFRNCKELLPDDAGFFSYARVQTLRAANLPAAAENDFNFGQVDDLRDHLYDTATGARAIQESLQVDRMLRDVKTSEPRSVEISSIEGVQTKSHPFAEMMKGKTPKYSELANLVPADQYMLRFTSTAKLQELADFGQQWGESLLESPEVGGGQASLRARYQKQLCLPSTLLSKLLGPAIVKEVVITGSDPFFREGTDLTVIFDTVSPQLFKSAVDQYWKAEGAAPKSETIELEGQPALQVEALVTPDRSVSAFRTTLDNLVIYSNSKSALQRVFAAKNKRETSLGAADDFRYMRAVWPESPQDEDGFLYLSDAFIRRLVGPATKIKEKRRLEAYGTMRMVLNAAMLHGYEHGPGKTPSLQELTKAGLLRDTELAASEGTIWWDPATAQVSNSIYGRPTNMLPLSELKIDKVTPTERDEYVRFRDRYQQYWRRYFDPIGVRIKVDKTISVEAYILPLIDETHYSDLKRLTGDKPAKFDLSKITTATLMRWQVSLDMDAREVRDARQMVGSMFGKDSKLTDWIGKWATIWIEDSPYANDMFNWFFEAQSRDIEEVQLSQSQSLTSFFQLPLALGVDVKNTFGLATFLVAAQGIVRSAAPDLVRFIPQDPYKGVTFVKIAPAPGGQIERELQRDAERTDESADSGTAKSDRATTVPDIGLYYATIGSVFYLTTQKSVLEHLADAADEQSSSSVAGKSVASREIEYNLLLTANPANALKARPLVEKGTAQISRSAERARLREAWLLYRCGLVDPNDDVSSASRKWFGGEISLPSGGKISYDPAGDEAVSSAWGPMRQLKAATDATAPNAMLNLVDSIAHLRAWLRFTEDGLISHVELERK